MKKILFGILVIGYAFISNESVFASCCFKPPKHGGKYTCENETSQSNCEDNNGVAYHGTGSCAGNPKVYCCYPNGDSASVVHLRSGLIEIKNDHPENLCGNDPSVALPVDIIDFVATSGDSGVDLNLTMTELNSLGVNIWRVQIDESGIKNSQKINTDLISGYAGPFEEAHFSLVDKNPLPGVNYYVIQDIAANGDSTLHCNFIRPVIVGNENPKFDSLRAESLCKEYTDRIIFF